LSYNLDDEQVSIPQERTIKDHVSVWMVVPECKSDFYPVNAVYPIKATLIDSSECKGVKSKWVYTWTGKGSLTNDQLIETGIIDYCYYVDGMLRKKTTGNWFCRLERTR